MKKTILIAFAGMMLFAFTQCGGESKNSESKNSQKETITGSKEYTEALEALNKYDKALDKLKNCDDLEKALYEFREAKERIWKQYNGSKNEMTEEEAEKFREQEDDVYTKEEEVAGKLGCY